MIMVSPPLWELPCISGQDYTHTGDFFKTLDPENGSRELPRERFRVQPPNPG
jgi:hypothetical protein